MDGFSGYDQINILPPDQHKTTFWSQKCWSEFSVHYVYTFHDIKHIVQPYPYDLPTHSMHRQDHPTHLQAIFLRCRYYHICLDPHKCVFCVESRQLLGFFVSIHGI
jgi:hypothetical protein